MIELSTIWIAPIIFILVFAWSEGFTDASVPGLSPTVINFYERYPNTYKLLLLSAIMFWPVVLTMAVSWGVSYIIWRFCVIFAKACQEIYGMVSR